MKTITKTFFMICAVSFVSFPAFAVDGAKKKRAACKADLADVTDVEAKLKKYVADVAKEATRAAKAESHAYVKKIVEETNKALKLAQKKMDDLNTACLVSKMECDALRDEVRAALMEIADYKTKLQNAQRELVEAKNEIKTAEEILGQDDHYKAKLEATQRELAAARAEVKAAEAMLDQVGQEEAAKDQQIAELFRRLNGNVNVNSGDQVVTVTRETSTLSVEIRSTGTPDPRLSSLKIGESDLRYDFSILDPGIWYGFEFARDGKNLRSGVAQKIRFEAWIVKWFQQVGLEIEKGKLLKQLTMGQVVNSDDQGLKHVVGDIWEIKIKDKGHLRIFVKKISGGNWVAFHKTNDLWVPTDRLNSLSSHL